MEFYEGDTDEVGTIQLKNTHGTVLIVDDSAFTEDSPYELVEAGESKVFILVRRSIVDAAINQFEPMELTNQLMEGARSVLATYTVLSE